MADASISEEWRVAAEWANYEVSNLGRIRRRTKASRYPAGLVLATFEKNGYLTVKLSEAPRKPTTISVHIIVCRAFHGPAPSPDHEAAHWDGNRLNAAAGNLRWATTIENAQDRIRHGRSSRGESHGQAKLTRAQVRQIRALIAEGTMLVDIARRFSIAPQTVREIKIGRSWAWLS